MAKETKEQIKNESDSLVKAANQRREVKEVATKLRHLSPVAKAEVVNEVVGRQVTRQVTGFTDFLRDQGVIGVGIGLVLGIQIKAVVDTIMASFVNPITQLILPGKEALSKKSVMVAFHGRDVLIGWGAIVYSLFTFIMVAIIIYVAYKMLKLDKLSKKKDK